MVLLLMLLMLLMMRMMEHLHVMMLLVIIELIARRCLHMHVRLAGRLMQKLLLLLLMDHHRGGRRMRRIVTVRHDNVVLLLLLAIIVHNTVIHLFTVAIVEQLLGRTEAADGRRCRPNEIIVFGRRRTVRLQFVVDNLGAGIVERFVVIGQLGRTARQQTVHFGQSLMLLLLLAHIARMSGRSDAVGRSVFAAGCAVAAAAASDADGGGHAEHQLNAVRLTTERTEWAGEIAENLIVECGLFHGGDCLVRYDNFPEHFIN